MPRVLTAARATVAGEQQHAYLASLRELAARLRSRDEYLWVFRHPTVPDTFLEFSESATAERHRTRRSQDQEEAALEVRLRTLAAYAPDSWVLWEEIPLKDA